MTHKMIILLCAKTHYNMVSLITFSAAIDPKDSIILSLYLYCANCQLMTVSINVNRSLKLSIISIRKYVYNYFIQSFNLEKPYCLVVDYLTKGRGPTSVM